MSSSLDGATENSLPVIHGHEIDEFLELRAGYDADSLPFIDGHGIDERAELPTLYDADS